ncbi:MAG: hypothetical protein ACLP0A_05465, partial [Verrucomicrobiia bacterium]
MTLPELAPRVAVTVADWALETVLVDTPKVAEVAVAGTVTDAGTVSAVLVLVRGTMVPPVGAAWLRVTVQVVDELAP